MSELFAQLDRVRATGAPAALATLVSTAGATPKAAGATMCVARDGAILGTVTIGGCVDARVIEAAPAIIGGDAPRVLAMALGDEDAWALGLTCGGTVEVLLQKVDPSDPCDRAATAYAAARAAHAGGRAAMVVARVDTADRLTVIDDGAATGTIGGTSLDAAARAEALERLAAGTPSSVAHLPDGADRVALYFEHLPPPFVMVIYGASEVAVSLVAFARELGMRTVVVDGRERFATRERFPTADEILVGMPSELVDRVPNTRHTAAVLLAHDYKYELPVLRKLLRSEVGYVGMLGGRKRGGTIKAMLADEGYTVEELGRLHTPIGLDIGATRTAEIALAVAAEIVASRRGKA